MNCTSHMSLIKRAIAERKAPMAYVVEKCPRPYYIGEHNQVTATHNATLEEDEWPLLTHLHSIRAQLAPRGVLFVLSVRATADWLSSVVHWNNLHARFTSRDIDGLPASVGKNLRDLGAWYEAYNAYVSFFFAHRPYFRVINASSQASLDALYDLCGDRKRVFPDVGRNSKHKRDDVNSSNTAGRFDSSVEFSAWRAEQPDRPVSR